MIIPEHHVSLNVHNEINAVCQDLFLQRDITFFIFIRFYSDGTIISLPNRPDWHKHFFNQEYYRTSQLRLIPGYRLWDGEQAFSQSIHDVRLYFNIDNKFEIIKKYDSYHEVFGFASSTGNRKMLNYYMNYINELEQFAINFKNEKKGLIEKCAKERLHANNRAELFDIAYANNLTELAKLLS